MILPTSRNENIVVQNVGNEVLVYDLLTNKGFCLNETSAIVYQACDGQTTFDELKKKHQKINDDVIQLAIFELNKENLLQNNIQTGTSRRNLLRKAAMTAIALPIITGIIAPKSIHAQSCVASGQPCSLGNPGACCSLTCINGVPTPTCA